MKRIPFLRRPIIQNFKRPHSKTEEPDCLCSAAIYPPSSLRHSLLGRRDSSCRIYMRTSGFCQFYCPFLHNPRTGKPSIVGSDTLRKAGGLKSGTLSMAANFLRLTLMFQKVSYMNPDRPVAKASRRTFVDTVKAFAWKCTAATCISLPSSCLAMAIALLPLINPITDATHGFGGISTQICI